MALALNMDLGAISARAGAPNDGLKKGKDDSERVAAGSTDIALWSKQNSDATGMRYQWGRKDPFTFATNSERNGADWQRGKYPVKLYNSNNVLIYQEDIGGDNSGKLPSGGVLAATVASSMSDAIANPITFYGNYSTVISQAGQSRDLYDYYWSSYSRGTDGQYRNVAWHNDYLDSYIPLRHKSIYDPCPYGYRTPSNGTYNEFTNRGWTAWSYVSGTIIELNATFAWISASGRIDIGHVEVSRLIYLQTSTAVNANNSYSLYFDNINAVSVIDRVKPRGLTVRCIEDCSVVSDATEASAGY